jgi:hypothetical protein
MKESKTTNISQTKNQNKNWPFSLISINKVEKSPDYLSYICMKTTFRSINTMKNNLRSKIQ